jgi:hypothetical protein
MVAVMSYGYNIYKQNRSQVRRCDLKQANDNDNDQDQDQDDQDKYTHKHKHLDEH